MPSVQLERSVREAVLLVNGRSAVRSRSPAPTPTAVSIVRGGQHVRKDTKTHQDRWLAIDPDTCALIATCLDETRAELTTVGVELREDAYLCSNDPAPARP